MSTLLISQITIYPNQAIPDQYHPSHFIVPNSAIVAYQQSFYARKINEWNHLPTEIIEQDNINSYIDKLLTLL